MQNDKILEGYQEYINVSILLKQYIKDKGIYANVIVSRNPFKKHKEIVILPIRFG